MAVSLTSRSAAEPATLIVIYRTLMNWPIDLKISFWIEMELNRFADCFDPPYKVISGKSVIPG